MIFGNDRRQIRKLFVKAWKKHQAGSPLEPLEENITAVISQHPEYHRLLENPDAALDKDFLPESGESNPFLHLGMHISLQEQLSTNRPNGFTGLYQQLVRQIGDAHEADHLCMECLGQTLWEAQRDNRMPDEQAYLECLRRILSKR